MEFDTVQKVDRYKIQDDANYWYNYDDVDSLLNNTNDLKNIIINFYNSQIPRLKMLEFYSLGKNTGILYKDRAEKDKIDLKASHDFGGYISTFNTGFLFGIPIKVEKDISMLDDEDNTNDILKEINQQNDLDTLNSELGFDCSRFGRAFEYHYRTLENGQVIDKIALSSVFKTFGIYDNTIEHKPICMCRVPQIKKDGKTYLRLQLFTDKEIIIFNDTDINDIELTIKERQNHFYNGIPIIEWKNNRFRTGDFENVLSSIDLYDASQTDTANYMADINDALLVISGDIDISGKAVKNYKMQKSKNMLLLKSSKSIDGKASPVNAEYIYKQYDVQGSESYKKRLENDIHKFTHTPNLSDENFSQNQSGVAMEYKLLGMQLKRAEKETMYKKALKERYRLISNIRTTLKDKKTFDANALKFTFTPRIPTDIWNEIKAFVDCGGEISQKTLRSNATFIENNEDEEKQIKLETINEFNQYTDNKNAIDYKSITDYLIDMDNEDKQR